MTQFGQNIFFGAIEFQSNCLSQQHRAIRYIIDILAEIKYFVNIIRGRAFPSPLNLSALTGVPARNTDG
jgi:hypothetical protein